MPVTVSSLRRRAQSARAPPRPSGSLAHRPGRGREPPCSSCRHSTSGSPSRRARAIARAALDPGGQRRQAGDPVHDRGAADLPAVGARPDARRRVDHEVDVPALDPVEHVRRALAELVQPLHRHAHARDRLRRAARGDDPKADVVQDLRDRERPRLVGVGDGDERRAAERQRHARGGLRLGERGREVARDPHHLAGRAHLRAEHRVGALEAVERQHRLLHRDVLADSPAPLAPPAAPSRRSARRA